MAPASGIGPVLNVSETLVRPLHYAGIKIGALGGILTHNPSVKSRVLLILSYQGKV